MGDMTEDRLDKQYDSYQKMMHTHPGLYKARFVLFSLLGYGYILVVAFFMVIAAVVMGLGFYLSINLLQAFLCIFFLWMLIITIITMVSMFKPIIAGGDATPCDVESPLIAKAETICKALRKKRIPKISLTMTTDAKIGKYGNRHEMKLGVLLMCLCNEAQYTAILAHEVAHYSLRHTTMGRFLFRASEYWSRLYRNMDQNTIGGFGSSFILRFYLWYVPKFRMMMSVYSQADELAADALASQVCGAQTVGDALVLVHAIHDACLSENMFGEYYGYARESETPIDVIAYFDEKFRKFTSAEWENFFNMGYESKHIKGSTHPSLQERLVNIGYQYSGTVPIDSIPAHKTLLNEGDYKNLSKACDMWIGHRWHMRRKWFQKWERDYKKLEEKADKTQSEWRSFMWLQRSWLPTDSFLALARERLLEDRYDPASLFSLGAHELYRGNGQGFSYFAGALNQDRQLAGDIILMTEDYLAAHDIPAGQEEAVRKIRCGVSKERYLHMLYDRELCTLVDGSHEQQYAFAGRRRLLGSTGKLCSAVREALWSQSIIKSANIYFLEPNLHIVVVYYGGGWRKESRQLERQDALEKISAAAKEVAETAVLVITARQMDEGSFLDNIKRSRKGHIC